MRFKSSAMSSFVVLFLITSALAIITPPNTHTLQTLHISTTIYYLLILTLILPYGLILFAAFYGYSQLEQYTKTLTHTTEGRAFKKITNGLGILTWGLALTTILNMVLSNVRNNFPDFAPFQVVVNHYAVLLVAIVAMTQIGDGTNALLRFVNSLRSKSSIRWLIAITTIIGVLFAHSVVHNSGTHNNPYYLSIYPLLLTIVVPYIYAWVVGLIATMDLQIYSARVKGVLYRKALQKLAYGLMAVILVSIAVQFLTATFAQGSHPVSEVLLVDYALLAADAGGYILIAFGAKRLKMIEEV